jgi:DNA-binding LacI/PurR family transcriptional regulator
MKSRSTGIIGIVLANLTPSLFYQQVLEKLTQRLQALDKQVLLFNLPADQPVDEILPRILGYQVDGLIIASTTPSQRIVERCALAGTPLVLLNRHVPDSPAHSVCCDSEAATRQIADILLDAGHQRLAYIAGIPNTETNRLRERGFANRLQERGYTGLLWGQGAYTYESGREAALKLLQRDDPPDAIFCAADIMALGAMDAAQYDLGIRVPDELSIIGFDDIPVAAWPSYNLTTVRQPIDQMISATIQLLDGKQPAGIGVYQMFPGQVVIRDSARLRGM